MSTNMGAPHRGAGGGARLSDCPAFRHAVHRVWRLGHRPVAELMLELAPDQETLTHALERYAGLDPALVEAANARDWLTPRRIIRIVEQTEGAGRP
jgi:hypothetical protein